MLDIHAQVDALIRDEPMLGERLDDVVRRFQAAYSVYCTKCYLLQPYHVVWREEDAAVWVDFVIDDERVRVYFAIEKRCTCAG